MQNFEQIRPAGPSDLFRLTEIYNEAIRTGRCTGDTREFSADERLPWFQEHLDPAYPLFVFERDGHVLGYLYLTAYRKGRGALRGTVEVSYYLDFRFHGQGIGSRLLAHGIDAARAIGYHTMLAILLSCNEKSAALLRKFGFEQWGYLPDVARIRGERHSHLYFGKQL